MAISTKHSAIHSEQSSGAAISVLAVMSSDRDRRTLEAIAQQSSWTLEFSASVDHALHLLTRRCIPVVILEQDLLNINWQSHLNRLASSACHPAIILASSEVTDPYWEAMLRCGGYDVVTTPLRETNLQSVICFAWNYWHRCYSSERRVFQAGSR